MSVIEALRAFSTWKCHICGDERPDEKISVLSKPIVTNGQVVPGGQQNIRYCNDRPACIEGAEVFSFFKASEEEKYERDSARTGTENSRGDC